MLQGVGDVFELRPMNGSVHEGPGKFLFVGRGIDSEALKRQLESCLKVVEATGSLND